MLDLGILIILLICGIIGYKRGLIDSLVTFLGTAVSLVLSFILYPMINAILKVTPLYKVILEWVTERVSLINFGTGVQTQGNAIIDNLNWLPSYIGEQLVKNNNAEVYQVLGVKDIVDYVSVSITSVIIGLLAVLITWLILRVAFIGILRTIGKFIGAIPVISGLNKLGGAMIGILKGGLILSIIGLIIPFIIAMPAYSGVGAYIQASYLAKLIYENNLIILIFNQLFGI